MDPLSNETDMSSNQPPGEGKVPQEFIKLYYKLLNECPEFLHQLYLDDSSALVSEAQDEGPPRRVQADNSEDIKKLMMMFGDIHVDITNYTPQDSLDDSLILLTTGKLTKKSVGNEDCSDTERLFTQAFVLAKQETGFYVKTDTLQIHSRGCPFKFLSRASIHLQEPGRTAHVPSPTILSFQPDPVVPQQEIQHTAPAPIQTEPPLHVYGSTEPIEVNMTQPAQPLVDNEPIVQETPSAPAKPSPQNNMIDSRSPLSKPAGNPRALAPRKPESQDVRVQPPVEAVAPISGPAPRLSYAQVLREKKVAAAAAAASQPSRTEDFKVVAQLPKQAGDQSYPPRQAPNQDSGWGQSLSGTHGSESQSHSGNAVVGSASNLKLFVSHLPLNVTTTKVAELFSIFGEVVDPGSVKIMSKTRNCTANITFQTEAGFRKALGAQVEIGNEKLVIQQWENRSRTPRQHDGRGGGRGRYGRRRGSWDHA